jgi:hypothetical protein
MILDRERLDVYRLALDFLVFANQVIDTLPRGRSHLCDQLMRASTSIVLNLAEGAGKMGGGLGEQLFRRLNVVPLALCDLKHERLRESFRRTGTARRSCTGTGTGTRTSRNIGRDPKTSASTRRGT